MRTRSPRHAVPAQSARPPAAAAAHSRNRALCAPLNTMAAAHLSSAWKAAVTLLAAQGQLPTGGDSPLRPTESVQLAAETYKSTLEVGSPPYANVQGAPCVVPFGTHEFGFSYGTPWTTNFTAPACASEYSVLYLRWEATCPLGVQFDRIAAVWINGVELLRTSTEEPDRKSGVSWEVVKDVTPYYDVVKRGGDVVVSLDNVIDGRYNSSFTVTLSAEFYKPKTLFSLDTSSTLQRKPDAVVPVSKSSTSYGWFTVEPNSVGTNYKLVALPRNTEELYLELFLSHHQCDEFYYANPPDAYAKPLGWCGGGPFREVQVLVDGELVGVVWPFPLLFTGGLNPYLWRPIVAIGAFNAPTYVLNLTPFLEHFVDSQQHNVTFSVDYGIDFWPIDGNLLAYTDKYGSATKAKVLEKRIESHVVPTEASSVDSSNANFTLHAVRDFYVKSSVTTSKGTKIYTLSQQLEYSNHQEYLENGDVGIFEGHTKVTTTQTVSALFGLVESTVTHVEDYPIYGRSYYKVRADGSYILDADLANSFSRSMTVKASPLDLLLPSFQYGFETKDVVVSLNGTASIDSLMGGNGSTTALYTSKSPTAGCFSRSVAASAGVLTSDASSTTCGRSLRTIRP